MISIWIVLSTVCFCNLDFASGKSIAEVHCGFSCEDKIYVQEASISTSPVTATEGEIVYCVDSDTRTFCERFGHWWVDNDFTGKEYFLENNQKIFFRILGGMHCKICGQERRSIKVQHEFYEWE